MPYVFVDELMDGQEEADVVKREDYEALKTEAETFKTESQETLNKALQKIEEYKTNYNALHKKYADMILEPKTEPKNNGKKTNERLTINDVFGF